MSIQNKRVSLQNNDSWRPTTGALRPNPDLPPQKKKKIKYTKKKNFLLPANYTQSICHANAQTPTEKHKHTDAHTHTWLIKTHTHLLELFRWTRLRGERLQHTSAGIAEHFPPPPPFFSLALVIMKPAWKCDPENKASSWGESHSNISSSVWTSLRSGATHSGHREVGVVPPSTPSSACASQTPGTSQRRKHQ